MLKHQTMPWAIHWLKTKLLLLNLHTEFFLLEHQTGIKKHLVVEPLLKVEKNLFFTFQNAPLFKMPNLSTSEPPFCSSHKSTRAQCQVVLKSSLTCVYCLVN